MTSDTTRVLRGVSVGALSALVTASAHSSGGGGLPSEAGALLLVVICAALGYTAAAVQPRALSRTWLMAVLGVAQLFGHFVIAAADSHHHAAPVGTSMLVAHLLATVVGAQLILSAEYGARRAISALRRMVPPPVQLPVDRLLYAPAVSARDPFEPRLVDLSGTGTRGPPNVA